MAALLSFCRLSARRRTLWPTLLLLGTACDYEKEPPIPPRHPKHDLVIEGGLAKYNGKPLPLGAPNDEWIKVLGMPDRVQGMWAIWDKLGLEAGTDLVLGGPTGKPVDCLRVTFVLFDRPQWMAPNTDNPARVFPGRVMLEGAPLYEGANLNFINRRLKVDCTESSIGFAEAGLPRTYRCHTKSPVRAYWLGVYTSDRADRPRDLEMCLK